MATPTESNNLPTYGTVQTVAVAAALTVIGAVAALAAATYIQMPTFRLVGFGVLLVALVTLVVAVFAGARQRHVGPLELVRAGFKDTVAVFLHRMP